MVNFSMCIKKTLRVPIWRQTQKRWFGQPVHQTHPHIMTKNEVTPGISKAEFAQRRTNLWESISKENRNVMAIIPSSAKAYMGYEVPYPFRQNTDFLYFSGFQEPDSFLLLTNVHSTNKNNFSSILFVPKRDVRRELWDGPRTGSARAVDLTGVDEAYDTDEFPNVMDTFKIKQHSFDLYYNHLRPSHLQFHAECFENVCDAADKIHPISKHTQQLRHFKSPAEQDLMRRACSIASHALLRLMQASKPQVEEAHMEALMDFECRLRGATRLAYPPVIAGGNRANIIHYIKNDQMVLDGEVLLVDAGCEYHGYSSDITRSWPVSGSFTPAQRALYEALLEVQQACVRLCTPHKLSLNQIHVVMVNLLGTQLKRLGIADPSASDADVRKLTLELCPHHVGHYLGMDVHDVDEMSRNTPLQPSTIVTIEPGLYIQKDNTSVAAKWRGVGMRIEDDVLICEGDQPEVLTRECLKQVDEIEAIVQRGLTLSSNNGV